MRRDAPLRRRILGAAGAALVSAAALPPRATRAAERPGSLDAFLDAVRSDRADLLDRWLRRGFDPDSVDENGDPVLLVAIRARAHAVRDRLLAAPQLKVDAANRHGETSLMIAALAGDLGSAAKLVERGAQVNRPGWTSLHYAATGGQLDAIRWLLERSAYIDAESPNRTTPLMMAARHAHGAAVVLLLDEGADPTVRNEAGLTAGDYLARNGLHDLARRTDEAALAFGRRHGAGENPQR